MSTTEKKFDLDEWIRGARRPERVAKVFSRPDLLADADLIQQELDATHDDRVKVALRKRLAAVRAELESSAHVFRFRAITEKQMLEIDQEHPIPDEDATDEATRNAAATRRMYATIAAQSLEPRMTLEQVEALVEAVGNVEFEPIINASVRANAEATVDAPFLHANSPTSLD